MLVKSSLTSLFTLVTMATLARCDFSSLAALRMLKDARFNYTLSGNFFDIDQRNSFNIDVYVRKSSHGNHLIFFKQIDSQPEISDEDQSALQLPFIAVVRQGFLRSMYAWPNDTRRSLFIKGELAQLLARDFTKDITSYIQDNNIELSDLPDKFELKTTIEDTPVGRGCYDTVVLVERDRDDPNYREIKAVVERGNCEEVFSFSSYYPATPVSSYKFVYRYESDSNELRGAETELDLNIEGSSQRIEAVNKLEFVEYVDKVEMIDDTQLKKRWAGYAELMGYYYAFK